MGDQDEERPDLLGMRVQETALEYGGPAWVFANVPGGNGDYLIEGSIIGIARGSTKGRDRYCVKWETGHSEKLKLDQVRRLMPANQGTAVTALPSSVRVLTAASCCSWNRLPARGGQYRGSCRGGCIGGGGTYRAGRWTVGGRRRWCANPPPDPPHPPHTFSFPHSALFGPPRGRTYAHLVRCPKYFSSTYLRTHPTRTHLR